ncbi:hypothetical protein LbFV_ORF87 [Leptopilina boulardi filamentous virus]|uniref:Uncharacterized protein n=1 Tax=Leptopilina boulardi filamentous virus TaxID=552509 RepID=A0A1S5YDD2_9VIRU|nr:hypothetical protein LbFV_ORF87 [Leptopilina boulardi filamentous virus]AQQ80007.1 hypothetical protein LbFV_ORF87 [Leptopilina boulardi filamentous virus]
MTSNFPFISELFLRIQDYYSSSGRDISFVKEIYGKELFSYYEKEGSCILVRNIIVASRLEDIYKHVPFNFIKQHQIFIIILYFDSLDFYKTPFKILKKKQTNIQTILNEFLSATTGSENIIIDERKKATFFSSSIGMKEFIFFLLSKYKKNIFNIVDLNLYNKNIIKDFQNFISIL